MFKKSGYQPIPDVEAGQATTSESAHAEYSDLEPEQADLMNQLDETIGSATIDLNLPSGATDPSKLASQGQSYLKSILTPTITAVCTGAIAMYLDQSAKVSGATHSVMLVLFPYMNAATMFAASVLPLQRRLLDAVEPLFAILQGLKEKIQSCFDDCANTIDSMIDDLQAKVKDKLQPIEPVMVKARNAETVLRKVDPDIDIPDTSEIDEEFDGIQGIVRGKLEQAKDRLDDVDEAIPKPLRSTSSFYWSVLVPIIVLAFLLQMIVVFATNSSPPPANTTSSTGRYLRATRLAATSTYDLNEQIVNVTAIQDDVSSAAQSAKDEASQELTQISSQVTSEKDQLNASLIEKQQELDSLVAEKKDQLNASVYEQKQKFDTMVSNEKDQLNATFTAQKEKFTAAVATRTGQMNATFNEQKEQLDSMVANQKSMVKSVILSYVIALLQIALVFLLTNEKVKAKVMGFVMDLAKKKADDKMRECGVSDAMEETFQVRLVRLRDKLLKIMKSYKKIKALLDKVGGTEKMLSMVKNPAEALEKAKNSAKVLEKVKAPAKALEKVKAPAKALEKVKNPAEAMEKVKAPGFLRKMM